MLLDSDEFIRLKPQYVPGVLDILRRLARRTACTYTSMHTRGSPSISTYLHASPCISRSEAQLLFAEARKNPAVSMPQLSESISRAILRVSDAAALQFESFSPEQKG